MFFGVRADAIRGADGDCFTYQGWRWEPGAVFYILTVVSDGGSEGLIDGDSEHVARV